VKSGQNPQEKSELARIADINLRGGRYVAEAGGGLIVMPSFVGAGAPNWYPKARAAILGLTLATEKRDLTRATLEGVCLEIRWMLEAARKLGSEIGEVRIWGGAAKSDLWNQIAADVYGVPAARTRMPEAGLVGAAVCAGVGVGIFSDAPEGARSMVQIENRYEPDAKLSRKYDQMFEIYKTAYQALGVSQDSQIQTFNEDARMFLERTPDQSYDLVMGDAFNDFSVPYHLTTREFNERVHAWLADGGMYVVNIIDGGRGQFLRAYVHTMRQTFDHVYLAPTIEIWRTATRSTFVIMGTDAPLDLDELANIDGGDGNAQLVRQLLSDEELDALLAERDAVILTDRYAPVDQMLAAVFLDQAPEE